MILSFHPCFVADHQIILGSRGLNSDDQSLISDARVIILPQTCSEELYHLCEESPALLFPSYKIRFEHQGKIGQSLLFKKAGLPHPETLQWNSVEEFRNAFSNNYPHEMPFLLKRDRSHESHGIYPIKNNESLETALEEIQRAGRTESQAFISQELIQTKGNVLRVVIIGRKAVSYWKRPVNPGEMITTIGKGARIDSTFRGDLQDKGKNWAWRLAETTGINLAAVDFVFPFNRPDPTPLFLEINYYFGRRGLGGSLNYYRLLFKAIQKWLGEQGFDPQSIDLV
jgi:ribosomal protein S6--L-glutamate ligase